MMKPYNIELRKVGESSGYGYYEKDRAVVEAMRDYWNSYTQETCTHRKFLHGAKCNLCGNKYEIVEVQS